MANSIVQVAPDSTGKKIQCFANTVGGQSVEAQAVSLVDQNGAAISTLPVSGPITNAEMRATPIHVDVDHPKTAFGEMQVAEPTPVCQLDWVYGLNSLTTTSTVTGSGTVTSANAMAICSTTAAASSSAQLTSRRYLKYRAGQGGLGRWTAMFTTGVAGSKQYSGIGTASLNDGYFFGYSGVTFGIWYINNGTPTHIPQASWNVDVMDGSGNANNHSGMLLVPTNGNVFQVKYQYLGFGAIQFAIEDQATGEFTNVHVIQYANQNSVPSVQQPSFNYIMRVENDVTTATNIVIKGATAALFLEGMNQILGLTYGRDNNKATITTETNIVSIRNCTTYNGVANRAQIRFRVFSFGSNTGGAVSGITTLKCIIGATLGGVPAYTTTNGTTADNGVTITNGLSVSSYDVAGTTITNGTIIFNSIVAVGNSQSMDVSNLNLILAPGETATFSITSTQSATVGVGVTWTEDI